MKKIFCYLTITLSLLILSAGLFFSNSSEAQFTIDTVQERAQVLEEMLYHPQYVQLTDKLMTTLEVCPSELETVNTTLNLLREYTFSHYNRQLSESDSAKKLFDEILLLLEGKISKQIGELQAACPQWENDSSLHGAANKIDEISSRILQLEKNCKNKNLRNVEVLKKRRAQLSQSDKDMKRVERQLKNLERRCRIEVPDLVRESR